MLYNDNGDMIVDDILFASRNNVSDAVADWWLHRIVTGNYKNSKIPTMTHFYNFIKLKGFDPVDLDMCYIGENYKIGLLRQECTMFNPVDEFDKCVECDKLHYHVFDPTMTKHLTSEDISLIKAHTLKLRHILPTGLK